MNYVKFSKTTVPLIYKAYASLGDSALNEGLRSLLELRVSQINGCSYCCTLHTNEAQKNGISQKKLDMLPTWYSSKGNGVFSDKELVSLRWCEAVTHCGLTDIEGIKKEMLNFFSKEELVEITSSIALMNALNRMAISLKNLDNSTNTNYE